ncbi:MAG: hypothetical protein R6V07_07100 [Armatimonadota bacterium]
MDDRRDDDIRPDAESAGEAREGGRSPFEPPRDDKDVRPEHEAAAQEDTSPAEGDFFTRLNAVPGDELAEAEPPFVVTERDFGEDEEEKGRSKAATFVAFGVVVMAVLGILMTVASVKLFTERADMESALEQSIDRLSTVYAGPEATDTSKRRIAWLRKTIDEGDFTQAQKAIQSLGTPEVERPSPLDRPGERAGGEEGAGNDDDGRRRLPDPAEDTNLPVEAQAFFEQHPKLWEAFFGFSVAIKQLEQAEAPVEELMQLRTQMVDAAEKGQTERVEDLLNQARGMLEGQSPDRMPQGLQTKLQAFGQAIQQAQAERRDVRAAVEIARKSERAAQQGNFERAERLMDQAIAAVKDAPRVTQRTQRPPSAGPGERGMPQMGPEIGLIKFVADLATNVMQAEERDLTQIWEAINTAAGAIREKNADQIREILGEAKESFHEIGDRRREMSAAIQRAQEKVRGAQAGDAPAGQDASPSEEQQRERQQMVMQRVERILAQVREMPEEQFEANRAQIVQAVLQAMSAPMQPSAAERLAELSPEERAREKMRLAGEMYRQLRENTDADTTELDEKFAEVRRLLTEHEYERAEDLVDEGVAMMRAMAQGERPEMGEAGGDGGDGGYGPQLQLERSAPSLDLRDGRGGSGLPVPPSPTDASEISDDSSEGVEQ